MKSRIITFILSIFLSVGLFAQDRPDYTIITPAGISSINEAATIAKEIVKAAGLKANFIIAEANVPNALAVLQDGKRYVLYNPGFVNTLTRITGTRWAAVSVLAHEIGHHLYPSFANQPNKKMATELEADKFSGYVLEKMGATLEEAQAAMNLLATPWATATHPARTARINSIASGWENAGGIVSGTPNINEDVSVGYPNNQDDKVIFSNSSFLAKLQFSHTPEADIYITSRLNVVRIQNDDVSLLGTVRKSEDENYPFVISDGNGYRLYISSAGQIVNARGRVVGKVTKA
ncbi:MAG TPA: hypothetical protein VMZ03_11115 [Chitinophagaceae bacterium]|nr:hypothetical protein [Chitinophagaceae bacterium]